MSLWDSNIVIMKRYVIFYLIVYYHSMTDYFKKIQKKIFLNNICLTFNFSELFTFIYISNSTADDRLLNSVVVV